MEKKRNFGLDLVRAIAISIVVLNHTAGILNPLTKIPSAGNLIGKGLAMIQPLGMLGVELFFVLSGFLIGNILISTVIKKGILKLNDIFYFWMRRWIRTVPVYWIILTILFFTYNEFKPKYYLFVQSVSRQRLSFFVESWSLPVEEFFYILLPIFIAGMFMFFRGTTSRKLLYSILGFIFLFTTIRIGTILTHDFTLNEHTQIRNMTFLRLDAIGYGVAIAWLSKFHMDVYRKYATFFLLVGIMILILAIAITYLGSHPALLWYDRILLFRQVTDLTLYSILPFACCLVLPKASLIVANGYNRLKIGITHISKISYSLYLVHLTLVEDLLIRPFLTGSILNAVLGFICCQVICLIVASILFRWVEVPIMNLRKHLNEPSRSITNSTCVTLQAD